MVHLLETTLIRVGNDDYAKQNRVTVLPRCAGRTSRSRGRSYASISRAKAARLGGSIYDRRVAKIVKACQELPGQELFQYLDEDGQRKNVTSADVNAYLR